MSKHKPTIEELNADIAAKSDQLNAIDLVAGPRVFTVTSFDRTPGADQPWNIRTAEHAQPWKPCKTMRRVLLKAWGLAIADGGCVGRRIELFADPNCKYAGKQIGGIRVSALTNIDAAFDVTVQEWRGATGLKTYHIDVLSETPGERSLYDELKQTWQDVDEILKPVVQSLGEAAKNNGDLTEARELFSELPTAVQTERLGWFEDYSQRIKAMET